MKFFKSKVRAPEFSSGKDWLNTNQPIKLAELRGKIVLLDFWTYCCINCIHILPHLKKLEKRYSKELVVIGVHSAKFLNERDSENLYQAILRYEIEHPVVNDSDFTIWQSYTVRAWPTLALIDPEGYLVDMFSGEGHHEEIDLQIAELAKTFRQKGKLKEEPLKLLLETRKAATNSLSFPGKILADETTQRLFISDSNNNRIVIATLEGNVIEVIGNGSIGADDGDFKSASFNHPQGLTLDNHLLYVADTENHLIRRVNLINKQVETVAGTGQQSRSYYQEGQSVEIALNSPWDLKLIGNLLFIAMAGSHQIWLMDTESQMIGPFAGTGAEACMDGSVESAAFAQPSGLAFDGQHLYIADSEISSIRAINLTEEPTVVSVVGSCHLFGFGDVDASRQDVRLQHPLGIEVVDNCLYIADTYNHKIKVVDLKTVSCKTVFGDGKGLEDGQNAKFYEPSGLSILGRKLYIADTNNHAIRVADLNTKEVKTLEIIGLES